MKHHGKYELPTPEELAKNLNVGGKEATRYVRIQIERIKRKYKNEKRHQSKLIDKTIKSKNHGSNNQ